MEHQIDALRRRSAQPNDSIDPRELAPLTRRYLKDAFRAVADVQRGLANEFGLTGYEAAVPGARPRCCASTWS